MRKRMWPFNLIVILMALSNHPNWVFAQNDNDAITCGHYETIDSKILGEERTVLIHLPSNYEESNERYPVLYILDGSKEVFLQCVSMTWYLEEMAEKTPGHIVVAIPSPDRNRDLGDGSKNFSRFIALELIPYMNANYRTSSLRILSGQSASSIFVFNFSIKNPGAFSAYILNSFGISNTSLERYEKTIADSSLLSNDNPPYLFFSHGKNDPYDPSGERTKNGETIIGILKEKMSQPSRIMYKTYPGEGHVPFPTVYDALQWIHTKK